MCAPVSEEDLARSYASYDYRWGKSIYSDHLKATSPEGYALYLEAKRQIAFEYDAAAALAKGWPTDEDLAGLVGSARTDVLARIA